jgi:hypothetical protein
VLYHQGLEVSVVAGGDVLGTATGSRHEISSSQRTARCETALWS